MTTVEPSHSVIQRLVRSGELSSAWQASVALISDNPTDVNSWRLAAEVAERCGRIADGAGFLRRALDLAPYHGPTLIAYGRALLRLGRPADAASVALQVEDLASRDLNLEDALGVLWTHLEQPARALVHFERALIGDPRRAQFRYNLALAQRMLGDFAAAEANLDRVISARPQNAEAYYARSDLRRQTADRNHIAELERLVTSISDRRASLPVAFALAKELEDVGEYERSFTCLHEASRTYRATLLYDVGEDIAVLDKLRKNHTRCALRKVQSRCESGESIFVVGLPRSGTTLVERILGSHSQVFAAGELDIFPRVAVEAVTRLAGGVTKLDFVDRSLGIDFGQLSSAYLTATRPRTGHTMRFTDKMPLNYLYAGLIHAALPESCLIALQRHPLDSCYAMYKTLFDAAYPFTYDLMDLARYYVAWAKLMSHWKEVIGDKWRVVSYESLINAQESASRQMLEHCGLSWEPKCLSFHMQPGAVTSASASQVRRPLYSDSVGKWRHYVGSSHQSLSI
jgi:tetratricopeptide (TPR) repeat protein